MYNHGFATLALAEAYGLTNDLRLGPALEKASKLIVSSQKSNSKGGWRYSPESQDADSTISGAQLVALFAARNAGIKVPEEAIEKGKAFLLSCQDSNGGFGYTAASGANLPRSAIGSLILSLAKETNTDAYRNSVDFLKKNSQFGDQGHQILQPLLHLTSNVQGEPIFVELLEFSKLQTLQSTQTENGSWNGNYGQTFATSAALAFARLELSLFTHLRKMNLQITPSLIFLFLDWNRSIICTRPSYLGPLPFTYRLQSNRTNQRVNRHWRRKNSPLSMIPSSLDI